jgi:hypothetical protein
MTAEGFFVMGVERRKHRRFKVEGGALAALSSSPSVAGHIINISEGGLSFRYIASQKRIEESPRLNLLLDDRRFHSRTLPFKSVWDSPKPEAFSFGSISFRHCGVNFHTLTDDERSEIKKFIRNHATPENEGSVQTNID